MKIGCITVLIISLLFAGAISIKPVRKAAGDILHEAIIRQIDKELAEMEEKRARGEIVRGRDTALIWENMFVIYHVNGEEVFCIEKKDKIDSNVLEKVKSYKIIRKQLYIVSEEGYAVVDKQNNCRVFVTVPDEEFLRGSVSGYLEDENIRYINSFDAFSDYEQKNLEKLEKKIRK